MEFNVWMKSKKYGKFKVLKLVTKGKHKLSDRYLIQFETGHTKEVSLDSIYRKNIRNEYFPIKYGVACVGNVKNSTKHFLFRRWENMIDRCYNPSNPSYNNYGEIGVHVCNSWLCFENYIEDVICLVGFDEVRVKNRELELDKDLLCKELGINPKIYSPKTCQWITKSNQLKESNTRRDYNIRFIATRVKDGYTEYSNSIARFSEKYNLNPNAICSCLKKYKYFKSHKGWVFRLS